jgi:hypothetical protein
MHPKGPWSRAQVDRYLAQTRVPIRLACNGGAGFPVVASLWFVPDGGSLWCATRPSARVARLLEADGRCAFEVASERPPYCGVRGQAVASLRRERGADVLHALVHRYLDEPGSDFARWLLSRADGETAIEITPRNLVSWDFRRRMGRAA